MALAIYNITKMAMKYKIALDVGWTVYVGGGSYPPNARRYINWLKSVWRAVNVGSNPTPHLLAYSADKGIDCSLLKVLKSE
jgi:hypothetical protein